MTTNIDLAMGIHLSWNAKLYDEILDKVDDSIETVSYSNGFTGHGKEQFREFFMGFKNAFPDIQITHRNVFASGNDVVLEFGAVGTNNGPLMTPNGPVPPTGRVVHFNVCEVHTWRNGRLVRLVNYQDAMSLMAQLGLLPEPAAA